MIHDEITPSSQTFFGSKGPCKLDPVMSAAPEAMLPLYNRKHITRGVTNVCPLFIYLIYGRFLILRSLRNVVCLKVIQPTIISHVIWNKYKKNILNEALINVLTENQKSRQKNF